MREKSGGAMTVIGSVMKDMNKRLCCVIQLVGVCAACVLCAEYGSWVWAQDKQGQEQSQEQEAAAEKAEQKTSTAQKTQKFALPQGLNWETNNEDSPWSDPQAQKGGTYRTYMMDYPATFRRVGPNSNSGFRGYMSDLGLVSVHPNTGNIIPSLATHWAVAPDFKTVYYKLDQRARWSDGKPVVPGDYEFLLEFMRSKHIQAPWYNNYYTEEIVAIRVHAPDVISIATGKKHPKHLLLRMTSLSPMRRDFYKLDENWVENYNWKVPPNTGPYVLSQYKHGQYVVFSRKKNWWGVDDRYNKNLDNFDHVHVKVIREKEAIWQHFIKGEVHSHGLGLAEFWYEQAKGEAFDKGYITKLWTYFEGGQGARGLWINESRSPFDNRDVRYALGHAINFDAVNKLILRGEWQRLESFYVGYGAYVDDTIKAREYSVEKASVLMEKSGYKRDAEGYWAKDGKRLEVAILYGSDFVTSQLLVLQEHAKKAGFFVRLDLRDPTAKYKATQEKKYDVTFAGFGSGPLPPTRYWEFFHSVNAKPQSNSLTMTRHPELDKLIDAYRATFIVEKKQELSRKILRLIHENAAVIPSLVKTFERLAYWSYLKLPKVPGTRLYGTGLFESMAWIDVKAEEELKKKRKAGEPFKSGEPIIDRTYQVKAGQ